MSKVARAVNPLPAWFQAPEFSIFWSNRMRYFIVHAHPEPNSFNGAMTRTAIDALKSDGHDVEVSDLYAMSFNPVSGRRNFTTVADPNYFRQHTEEAYAAEQDGFVPELKRELEKLYWCDAFILQFPLWWFSMPAIMKGWVDRVFASAGKTYGGGRWYSRGIFAGKRAMCSITIGGGPAIFSEYGLNGPISTILFPINHGILYFTGFTVVEPFLVHAPVRIGDEDRAAYLERYRDRVRNFESAPIVTYPPLDAYDEQFLLKPAYRT